MPKCKRYYMTRYGHAAGVDFLIRSPHRSVIANVMGLAMFGDTSGIDDAKADAQFIVDALNAYAKGGRP